MEQLNSMFTRLKRGFSTSADSTQPSEKPQSANGSSSAVSTTCLSDDDGFLLVDGVESECTTVYASSPKRLALQSPLATSQATEDGDNRAGRGISMFATCSLTPLEGAAMDSEGLGITGHPSILGIPFQLNPRLVQKDQLSNALTQLDLQTARFDWQKYNYDFSFEQSSLEELCTMENRTLQVER